MHATDSCLLVCLHVVVLGLAQANQYQGCNEAVCASLVSKCMLLKSCECDLSDKKNCSCCKDCHRCLSKLYTECCSCVGLCPVSNMVEDGSMSSTVAVLPDPIPDLFDVLTEEEDPEERWNVFSYPAHLDLLFFKPRGQQAEPELELELDEGSEQGHRVRHGSHHAFIRHGTEYHNCTVAYMSQCMSLNKCNQACRSMGAARYRWFHGDGCCECIGGTCLDYGMGEPRCLKCPPAEDEEEEEEDYGYNHRQQHQWDAEDDAEFMADEQNRYVSPGFEGDVDSGMDGGQL